MRDPILIAGPARCGTTMIAWLLHLHGVWIGKAGVTKSPETNPLVGTENTRIKQYLKGISGVPDDFRERIEAMVPDGPWLVKTPQNLVKQDAWLRHFPEAKWVLPSRCTRAIVDSAMRHPGMKQSREQRTRLVDQHKHLQERLAYRAKFVHWVDTDPMANGDEDVGRALVEYCGLDFDPEIFHGWIKPERWHD